MNSLVKCAFLQAEILKIESGKKMGGSRTGYCYVVLAALLWALSGSASKFLFVRGISPFELVQLRTSLGTVALFVWLLIRQPRLLRISREDMLYFCQLGIALATAQFTYFYAISKMQVAAAILLQYQAPVLIAVYASMFSTEELSPLTLACVAGAIAGCYLTVGGYSLDLLSLNRAGIVAGLASAAAFAWYTVSTEYGMRKYNPWTVVFYALLVAAVVWNILQPPLHAFFNGHGAVAWIWISFIGICGTVLAFGFYTAGVARIRPTRASVTATLEPIIAGFVAYLFLDEVMKLWQVVGAIVVIASIVSLQIRRMPAPTAPINESA
jgi:drug/metabolite transporter (DMT)-like permease